MRKMKKKVKKNLKQKKSHKLEKSASNASAKNKSKPAKKEVKRNNEEDEEEESGSIHQLIPKQTLPQQFNPHYQHYAQTHFTQFTQPQQFAPFPQMPTQQLSHNTPQFYAQQLIHPGLQEKVPYSLPNMPSAYMPMSAPTAEPKNSPQRRGKLSEILCTDNSEFNPDDNMKGFSVMHKQ